MLLGGFRSNLTMIISGMHSPIGTSHFEYTGPVDSKLRNPGVFNNAISSFSLANLDMGFVVFDGDLIVAFVTSPELSASPVSRNVPI